MKIVPYAEVFSVEHPLHEAYVDGYKKTPGRLLREVLSETGGRYEVSSILSDEVLADIQRLGAVGTDERTMDAIRTKRVHISFEHLRGLDPDATRIVLGFKIVRDVADSDLGSSP